MRENPFRTHHASPSSSPTLPLIKSGNNLTKAAFSSFFRLNEAQGWFCLVPYTFQVSQTVKDVGAREIDTVGVQGEWKLDLPVSDFPSKIQFEIIASCQSALVAFGFGAPEPLATPPFCTSQYTLQCPFQENLKQKWT